MNNRHQDRPESQPRVIDQRYELSAELGHGSTATVWDGRDRETGRAVAVKVIRRDQTESSAAWKRFLREVESARALRHPHTVEVLAHGRTETGEAYLVMERLVGTTLAARLRADGPLPAARAIKIAGQLLDAVGAAHSLGIVHRDLKPNNVLLIERDGDPDFVKVCDFGLAKAVDPDHLDGEHVPAVDMGSLATEQGQVCGTPEYMAPEQARGEALDGRADLYAVGAILYQMVVGQLPFQGRTPLAVISMHLGTPAPRPSAVRRDLEIFPALENLILRALAKDKSERPSSAAVFRADLVQIERDISRRRRKSVASGGGGDRDTLAGAPAAPDTLRTRRAPRRALVAALGTVVGGAVIALLILQRPGHHGPSPSVAAPPPAAAPAAAAVAAVVAASPVPPAPPPVEQSPAVPAPAERPAPRPRKPRSAPIAAAQPAAAAAAPADPATLLRRADDQLAAGRIEEACALGQAAAERAPSAAAVWEFLGRCYMRAGDPEKARTCYQKALALEPAGPNAMFIRAILKKTAARAEKAPAGEPQKSAAEKGGP